VKVAVIGATGVLGRAALPALIAAGHAVRAAVRDESLASALRRADVEPVRADLFDPAALRELVAGAEAVVNLTTRIPALAAMWRAAAWRENDRIRGEGARLLVDAALAADARVYVQESITFLYPDRGEEWIDESTPIGTVSPRLRSALVAEAEAARFAGASRRSLVLRFAALYGPDAPGTREIAGLVRRRLFPITGDGRQFVSSIHAADAGAAVAAILDAPGGTYNVGDDEPLRMAEYVRGIAAALGAPAPFHVPAALARLLGAEGLLLTSQRISNRRLRSTGWSPRYRSAIDGWRAIAERLRERPAGRAA
jgi:nucleoside-diphosphate-sugar epimerase